MPLSLSTYWLFVAQPGFSRHSNSSDDIKIHSQHFFPIRNLPCFINLMKLWSTNMTITSFLGRSLARLPLPSLGGMRYLVETKRRVKTKIVIIQNSYINGSGRVRLPPEEWLEEKKNWYEEGRLMSRSYYTVQCWICTSIYFECWIIPF